MATSSRRLALCLICLILGVGSCATDVHRAEVAADRGWPIYGGNWAAQRYSPLTQINRSNVRELQVAWRFDSAEAGDPETNPLIVGRTGFRCAYRPVALDVPHDSTAWRSRL